jgi:hypothetical protein
VLRADEQRFVVEDPDVGESEVPPDVETGLDTGTSDSASSASSIISTDGEGGSMSSDDAGSSISSDEARGWVGDVGAVLPSDEEVVDVDEESGSGSDASSGRSAASAVRRELRTQADSEQRITAAFYAVEHGDMTEAKAVRLLKSRGLMMVKCAFWRAQALPPTGVHGLVQSEPLHDFDLGDCKDTILYLRSAIHSVEASAANHRQREAVRLRAMAANLTSVPPMSIGCGKTYRRLGQFHSGFYVPGHMRTAATWRQMVQLAHFAIGSMDSVLPRSTSIGIRVRVALTRLLAMLVEIRFSGTRTEAEINQYVRHVRRWIRGKHMAFGAFSPSGYVSCVFNPKP